MDEADRMVHLGFEADLTFILDALPSETMEGEDQGEQMDVDGEVIKKGRTRVTTLFSATMPAAVERLARKYLKKPAIITIGEAGRAVDTVEQRVEFVNGDEKKKWVLLFSYCLNDPYLVVISQTKASRNSQQWPIRLSDYRVRQPEEDSGHGGQRSITGRSMCSFPRIPYPHVSYNFYFYSGVHRLSIQERTRSSEKLLCKLYAAAKHMSL